LKVDPSFRSKARAQEKPLTARFFKTKGSIAAKYGGQYPDAQIAVELGRSLGATVMKAHQLRISLRTEAKRGSKRDARRLASISRANNLVAGKRRLDGCARGSPCLFEGPPAVAAPPSQSSSEPLQSKLAVASALPSGASADPVQLSKVLFFVS
jgi:hypothetical protein